MFNRCYNFVAPPGLKMTIVQTQENGWYLLLHDPVANSLLCIDFARSSKMSVMVFLNKIPVCNYLII